MNCMVYGVASWTLSNFRSHFLSLTIQYLNVGVGGEGGGRGDRDGEDI